MRCPKCGVEYPENGDRCINCGNPINENSKNDIQENNVNNEPEIKKSYMSAKLLGLIGIIFFPPLAVVSGLYLVTRKEKNAKYWGIAFLIIGLVLWIGGMIMIYTMGYDKFMATYNLTNYSADLTNYGFKF
ncbi:hypothetical protein [Methanobacterium petrolearium]|uniref:hypothetical protein n=1 Tax=Methanobacterium petrolearium TaxID=710190 RepID=UPI001AE2578B|nr:hypothetical protein [Methanobacterium petrolearium]MBP1945214.1 hypothetical protein [Methanobacterium petrolearium]BDZ71147.1 hypothetical protein GCM10025861_16640 [Methanobacterium petrolearium]